MCEFMVDAPAQCAATGLEHRMLDAGRLGQQVVREPGDFLQNLPMHTREQFQNSIGAWIAFRSGNG